VEKWTTPRLSILTINNEQIINQPGITLNSHFDFMKQTSSSEMDISLVDFSSR